jgi:hypothetical protein
LVIFALGSEEITSISMKRLATYLVILFAALLVSHTAFSQSPVYNKTNSTLTIKAKIAAINHRCPADPIPSLLVYRFRHGIDRGQVVFSTPTLQIIYVKPCDTKLIETLIARYYFRAVSYKLPPSPDFLSSTPLRAPPVTC